MLSYIIHLEDACNNMNYKRWNQVEKLSNKYNIKHIVDIILK